LRVQFLEGAPKDTFIFTNQGSCDIGPAALVIDFTTSDAGLIFDVTADGAGVEVFQPFDVTQGADLLTGLPTITDGDQTATLMMTGLAPGQKIAFTIDVDDTQGAREITVSGSEIKGATVSLTANGQQVSADLGADAEAVLATAACTS
jgi:hypothetical protein